MMTDNRFNAIKKALALLVGMRVTEISLETIGTMVSMLQELVAEIDRRNTPTPARTSGPRPVILDAQGNAVLPPPIALQFEGERRNQYALDRHEAVMSLAPEKWRVFSLRWGLTPPPGGWDNHEAILNVMHAVRLGVVSVPYLDKHVSAVYLTSKGIKLPPGVTLRDGILSGVEIPEE